MMQKTSNLTHKTAEELGVFIEGDRLFVAQRFNNGKPRKIRRYLTENETDTLFHFLLVRNIAKYGPEGFTVSVDGLPAYKLTPVGQ